MLGEVFDERLQKLARCVWVGVLGEHLREIARGAQEIQSRALAPGRRDRFCKSVAGLATTIPLQQQAAVQTLELGKREDLAISFRDLNATGQRLLGKRHVARGQSGVRQKGGPGGNMNEGAGIDPVDDTGLGLDRPIAVAAKIAPAAPWWTWNAADQNANPCSLQ